MNRFLFCGGRSSKISSGLIPCQCDLPNIYDGEMYNWVQYIEHERKGVLVEYKRDKQHSKFEHKPFGQGVAETVQEWYHVAIKTEVPKPLRVAQLTKEG